MSKYIDEGFYYCEISKNANTYEVEAGSVVSIRFQHEHVTKIMRIVSYSDRAYFQNEDGDIRLIKDNINGKYLYDIIKDEDMIKEFMWLKLKAKELSIYA